MPPRPGSQYHLGVRSARKANRFTDTLQHNFSPRFSGGLPWQRESPREDPLGTRLGHSGSVRPGEQHLKGVASDHLCGGRFFVQRFPGLHAELPARPGGRHTKGFVMPGYSNTQAIILVGHRSQRPRSNCTHCPVTVAAGCERRLPHVFE